MRFELNPSPVPEDYYEEPRRRQRYAVRCPCGRFAKFVRVRYGWQGARDEVTYCKKCGEQSTYLD